MSQKNRPDLRETGAKPFFLIPCNKTWHLKNPLDLAMWLIVYFHENAFWYLPFLRLKCYAKTCPQNQALSTLWLCTSSWHDIGFLARIDTKSIDRCATFLLPDNNIFLSLEHSLISASPLLGRMIMPHRSPKLWICDVRCFPNFRVIYIFQEKENNWSTSAST